MTISMIYDGTVVFHYDIMFYVPSISLGFSNELVIFDNNSFVVAKK